MAEYKYPDPSYIAWLSKQKMDNKKEELREELNILIEVLNEIENMPDKDNEKEEIYNAIGHTYLKLKEYEKAIEYFKKALEISDKYYNMHMKIMKIIADANELRKLKRYDEAEMNLYLALRETRMIKQSNPSDFNMLISNGTEAIIQKILSLIRKETEEEQLRRMLK